MSAALQVDPCRWTEAEIDRAKALKREGYTLATVAAALNEEFGTGRNKHSLQTKLGGLARPAETRAADAARKAAKRLAIKAEMVAEAAPRTMLRLCLTCGEPFDSHGPGNRICPGCKQTEVWR